MVTAASKYMFSGGPEPYLTMITEYEGSATTFNYNGNVQPGDLVIVCAAAATSSSSGYPPAPTLTPTNATLAISGTDIFTTTTTAGGDTQIITYWTNIAAVYYRIAQSETSIVITGAGDVSGYIIRNANGPLYSASVFDASTDTDGDHTIATATNVAGTVRAVAIYAPNTAKFVLNGVEISAATRDLKRQISLGYESDEPTERIFGANDNDNLQDCCSIDPQSGTGSLRLDSTSIRAAAAAVFTVT